MAPTLTTAVRSSGGGSVPSTPESVAGYAGSRVAGGRRTSGRGSHKISGAPLGRGAERDEPTFASNPADTATPEDAHIRLAPRTPETAENRVLRRGFSFSRGFDGNGQLHQGLAFVCYQRSLAKGFVAVQRRLTGEPLEEYILPVGGGYFFALPAYRPPTATSATPSSADRDRRRAQPAGTRVALLAPCACHAA